MQTPIYARPSDEVGQLAVLTLATGVEDPNYPVENVVTLNPAEPFLTSSDDTAVDLVWDHLAAVDVKLFSLHHHNIPAGTNVRIQRNATNVWGAPTIDAAVVIGAYPQPGLPLPVGVDLTQAAGYDAGGFRYTHFHIPLIPQLVGLGSALLWGAKRTDFDPVFPPNVFDEQQPATLFKTTLGARKGYRLGVRLRAKPGRMGQFDTGFAAFMALFRECSTVSPFLWWADPTYSSDAWLAGFAADRTRDSRPAEGDDDAAHEFDFMIEEIGNGVALPTTAEVAT